MVIKKRQHTQFDLCAFKIIHETLGFFEIVRTTSLESNENMTVQGEYISTNIYGKALIKINADITDRTTLRRVIAHELLHHVFDQQVHKGNEEKVVTVLSKVIYDVTETASALTDKLLEGQMK